VTFTESLEKTPLIRVRVPVSYAIKPRSYVDGLFRSGDLPLESNMDKKQIETVCPCCATSLVVDALTGKVLRHAKPSEVDETGKMQLDPGRWDGANERVSTRATEAADKFEEALDEERSKESRLDDLFDKAKKKVDEGGEGESPLD